MAKTTEKQDRCGQKETIRTVQTALWVCLILMQMAVVNCLETRAEEIRRDVLYEAVEGNAEFPQEIEVTILAGMEEELVTCAAECVEEAASYWSDDFTFPLTVYDYGADEYRLGDTEVSGADALEQLAEDYGAELLESMELLPEEYEIIGLRWTGEPYENGEGILCRDAEGQGRRLLRDYRVTYRGFVEPERWEQLKKRGYGDDAELEIEAGPETQEETQESESALAEPETETAESRQEEPEKRQKTKLQEFLEKVTQILLVAVGIGAIFFFGGLLVLLLIRTGRRIGERRRKRKQERAYEKHVRDRKSH